MASSSGGKRLNRNMKHASSRAPVGAESMREALMFASPMLRRALTTRTAFATRLLSTNPPPPASAGGGSGKPIIPDATTVFKMSNPEQMLDPKKRSSWVVTGVVALGCAAWLGWAAWKDYNSGIFDAPAPVPAPADAQKGGVAKVLPDGRRLMRDGSIQPP